MSQFLFAALYSKCRTVPPTERPLDTCILYRHKEDLPLDGAPFFDIYADEQQPDSFARLWLRDQLPFRAPLLEMPTERTSLSLEHQICLVAAANACDFLAPFESANANTAAARISTVVADDVAPLTAVSRALDGSGDGHALSPRGPAGTGSVDSQIAGWHAASGPVQSERGDTYDSYPPATAWEEGHPDGFWTAAHNPLGHGMGPYRYPTDLEWRDPRAPPREHPWGQRVTREVADADPTSLSAAGDYAEPAARKGALQSGAASLGASERSCHEQCTWLRSKVSTWWAETSGGHDKECTAARVWFETGCWHDGTPILSNEHYATRPLFHQKTKLLAMFSACEWLGAGEVPQWALDNLQTTSDATDALGAPLPRLKMPGPAIPFLDGSGMPDPRRDSKEGAEVRMAALPPEVRTDFVQQASPPPPPPPDPPPPPPPPPPPGVQLWSIDLLLDLDAKNAEEGVIWKDTSGHDHHGSMAFADLGQCTESCPPTSAWNPAPGYFSNDGDCDDGGAGSEYSICKFGQDCVDCGPRPGDNSAPKVKKEGEASFLEFRKRSYIPIKGLYFPAGVRIPTLTVEVWFRTTFMGGPTRHVLGSGQACSTVTWRNSCCRAADGRVGTSFEYQSCLPAKNGKTFPSGAVCEPQSVVEANGWLGKAKQCARWFQNWAFIDFDRSEAFNFFLRADNGRLAVGAPGNKGYDYYETSGPSLADGRWHHAAFVLEPTGVLAIYRDAQPSTLNAQPGRDIGGGRQRYGFIGDGSEADTFDGRRNNIKFNGDIARVRVHRGALASWQVHHNFLYTACSFSYYGCTAQPFSPLHSYASSAIVATYVYEWCSEGSDLCREHMSDCAAACDANGHCGGATFRGRDGSPPQARCLLGSKGGWLRGRTQSDPNDWGYARPNFNNPPPPPPPPALEFRPSCTSAWENGAAHARISCLFGSSIEEITFAGYGLPAGKCGYYVPSWCESRYAQPFATRACVGARTCDLTEQLSGGANDFNKVLGDPCPMWRKFLKAEARCGVEKYRVAGVGQVCAASQGEVSEGKPALSLDDSLLEALLACQERCEARAGCSAFAWDLERNCKTYTSCTERSTSASGSSTYLSYVLERHAPVGQCAPKYERCLANTGATVRRPQTTPEFTSVDGCRVAAVSRGVPLFGMQNPTNGQAQCVLMESPPVDLAEGSAAECSSAVDGAGRPLGGASALAVYSYKCADWEPVAGWKDLGLNDALLDKLGSDMSRSKVVLPEEDFATTGEMPAQRSIGDGRSVNNEVGEEFMNRNNGVVNEPYDQEQVPDRYGGAIPVNHLPTDPSADKNGGSTYASLLAAAAHAPPAVTAAVAPPRVRAGRAGRHTASTLKKLRAAAATAAAAGGAALLPDAITLDADPHAPPPHHAPKNVSKPWHWNASLHPVRLPWDVPVPRNMNESDEEQAS